MRDEKSRSEDECLMWFIRLSADGNAPSELALLQAFAVVMQCYHEEGNLKRTTSNF